MKFAVSKFYCILFAEILSQYCGFLQQVGHMERAVATYQAMAEFTMFCPDKYRAESLEDMGGTVRELLGQWCSQGGRGGGSRMEVLG